MNEGIIDSVTLEANKEGRLIVKFNVSCGYCNSIALGQTQIVRTPQGNILYSCKCGNEYVAPYNFDLNVGKTKQYSTIDQILSLARHLF
jgi:hypothetical protein